jgi:hypothetical protein
MNNLDYSDWISIYQKLVNWSIELDRHPEMGLKQTLIDQYKEANKEFSKFVENNYKQWIADQNDPDTPTLTTSIVDKYVLDSLKNEKTSVFFFVLDCLRLDQWFVMEEHLRDYFNIEKDYYYSILPTATPYARNSLFSGLFPSEIENYYPKLWQGDDDEKSMNKYEKELLQLLLDRKKIRLRNDLKYLKNYRS